MGTIETILPLAFNPLGLDLRDLFAAAALQAIISAGGGSTKRKASENIIKCHQMP